MSGPRDVLRKWRCMRNGTLLWWQVLRGKTEVLRRRLG